MRADRDTLIRAGRALGRIDTYGERGLTMLSTNDIEAMALALVMRGIKAIPPNTILPATFNPIIEETKP
jgi:hypothetical protein